MTESRRDRGEAHSQAGCQAGQSARQPASPHRGYRGSSGDLTMTTRVTHAAWSLARGAYLASTVGMAGSTAGLFTIIFLFPLVLSAQGLVDALGAAGTVAEAVEVAADGSIVRMLLLALIASIATQAACVLLVFRLMFRTASKPCVLQSEQAHGVIRDTLRECWRDAKREEMDR